jgi:putative membrane protein
LRSLCIDLPIVIVYLEAEMETSIKVLVAAAALTAAASVHAQSQTPPGTPGSPTDASSPHQREATRGGADATRGSATEAPATGSPEASAASSPHQKSVTHEKMTESKLKMASQDGAIPATFVKKAALDGMTEVELGKVAMSKAQDDKVRQFAQRMVADHGKANTELASIAKAKSLQVPTSLDAEHKSMVQALSSKSGTAFDTAYSEHMNEDHAKAIALFEGASKGTDAELASFAKKTLPTLKEHKQMAEALPGTRTADASDGKSSAR